MSCDAISTLDKQCCKVKETKEKAVENDREKIRVFNDCVYMYIIHAYMYYVSSLIAIAIEHRLYMHSSKKSI